MLNKQKLIKFKPYLIQAQVSTSTLRLFSGIYICIHIFSDHSDSVKTVQQQENIHVYTLPHCGSIYDRTTILLLSDPLNSILHHVTRD